MAAIIFGIAILAAVEGYPLTLIGPVILVSGLICGLNRY